MRLLFSFLFLSIFVANAQTAKKTPTYTIKFKINGLKNTECYIAHYHGDKQYLKDTAKVDANGNMTFSSAKEMPKGMYLLVMPSKRYFEFVFTENNFSMEATDTNDFVGTMKVKNSVENENFYKYLKFISEKSKKAEPLKARYDANKDNSDSTEILRKQLNIIDEEVKKYKEDFLKANPKLFISTIFRATTDVVVPEAPILPNGRKDSTFAYRYYKEHYFDNIDLTDDRIAYTPILHNKIDFFMKKMVLQMPDSIIKEADILIEKTRPSKEVFKYTVHYITNTYETSNIMGMDAVFVHMAEKYYNTKQAFWLDSNRLKKIAERASVLKTGLVGQKAVNLSMNKLDGSYINLYDIKADYTILYFWDPGCGHCKKVTPVLLDFYNKNKANGVEVFSVGCGDDYEEWKKYIEDNKLNWINVMDFYNKTNFRKIFDIYSTPVSYVLDKNKKIIAKRLTVEQIEELLERLRKEK
jgi:thiol-disulfide isomerase/thioredoxin